MDPPVLCVPAPGIAVAGHRVGTETTQFIHPNLGKGGHGYGLSFIWLVGLVFSAQSLFYFIYLFILAVHGPLTVVASPVAERRLGTRMLSGHGSRAQPLRGMWDLPGPGHEPMSPASAGGPSTTAPPGKPTTIFF